MQSHNPNPDDKLIWTEISRKQLFEKFSRGIDDVVFKFPDNQIHHYFIKNEPDTVCTLAFDQNNQVILAQQFRPGPQKVLLTLPGGGLEPGHDPISSATRELMEEVGYESHLNLTATFFDDGYSTSRRYCFLAVNCTKTNIQKLDPTEFINTVQLPIDIFMDELRNGSITDPEAAYAAIDFINKNADSRKEYSDLSELFKKTIYTAY
jgi:ADP-ribose pyrophosphatase